MFLVYLLCGAVASLGVLLLQKKPKTILFLGLDNAGKTTLMCMLRHKIFVNPLPSKYTTMEGIMSIGKFKFKAWTDVGRPQIARRVSQTDYRAKVDAVVYMIDAHDKERFPETKKELDALLSDESLAAVPFLILGNKIDMPHAASEKELCYYIGLNHLTTGKEGNNVNLAADSNDVCRPMEVFMCSIQQNMGYAQGFGWLSQYIN